MIRFACVPAVLPVAAIARDLLAMNPAGGVIRFPGGDGSAFAGRDRG